MSRLLFAAARGARIEYDWYGDWRPTNLFPLTDHNRPHRIQPKDEHLQYGPISTAFRGIAEHPPKFPDCSFSLGIFESRYSEALNYRDLSPTQRQFYLLLLAEYLADEGL